jgi:hypothetical protein
MGHEAFAASHLIYLARLDEAAGDVDRAAEHIADALAMVQEAGEHFHLPGLLRLRAAYALAQGAEADQPVADLREAVRVAIEQGSRVTRLRAALELSRVPPPARPQDWRTVLSEARADLPHRSRPTRRRPPTTCWASERDAPSPARCPDRWS